MTTKGTDNRFRYLNIVKDVDPATPPTGDARLFVDSADLTLKWIDDDGTVTALTGGAAVDDATISTSDITTNNASTSKHGWLRKLDNNAAHYLDGTGAWSTPGGSGGALVLLEQHAASASSTLDFTSFISSTYDEYLFELLNVIPGTDAQVLKMFAGTGGGPTYDTGANYGWYEHSLRIGGTDVVSGGASGQSFIQLAGVSVGVGSNANYGVCGSFRLYSPQSSLYKRFQGDINWYYTGGSDVIRSLFFGQYLSATAMTALQFKFASGTLSSGIIRAYGVAK